MSNLKLTQLAALGFNTDMALGLVAGDLLDACEATAQTRRKILLDAADTITRIANAGTRSKTRIIKPEVAVVAPVSKLKDAKATTKVKKLKAKAKDNPSTTKTVKAA